MGVVRSNEKTLGYKLYDVFLAAFVALLLLTNIIAVKLIAIGPIVLTAAVFVFPLTYIFGDVLTEVYGYSASRRIIWLGFGSNVLMSLLFWMAIALPYPEFWVHQQAFVTILGSVPRIVVASLLGYWIGEFLNSYVLARMKEWMVSWDPQHKHLWMRTVGSTVVGESADSIVFVLVGFFGTMPFPVLLSMVWWQIVVKIGVEVVFTPITYWIVGHVKRIEGVDVVGANTYNPFVL